MGHAIKLREALAEIERLRAENQSLRLELDGDDLLLTDKLELAEDVILELTGRCQLAEHELELEREKKDTLQALHQKLASYEAALTSLAHVEDGPHITVWARGIAERALSETPYYKHWRCPVCNHTRTTLDPVRKLACRDTHNEWVAMEPYDPTPVSAVDEERDRYAHVIGEIACLVDVFGPDPDGKRTIEAVVKLVDRVEDLAGSADAAHGNTAGAVPHRDPAVSNSAQPAEVPASCLGDVWIAIPLRIAEDSWLMAESHDWFREGYEYACTQTRAIPTLSKVHPEELYFVVRAFLRKLEVDVDEL